MRTIRVDQSVYDEIARRIAGQGDLVGVYLKGFVDGMIKGFDAGDFAFKLIIEPAEKPDEPAPQVTEANVAHTSTRNKLAAVFMPLPAGTTLTIAEVVKEFRDRYPKATISHGALSVVHRNLPIDIGLVAEEKEGRKVFRKL